MLSPLCRTTAKQVAKTLSSPPLFDKNLKIWRKSRFLEEEVEEAWIRSVSNVTLLLYLYEGLNFGSELFSKCVELFGLLCACTTTHQVHTALSHFSPRGLCSCIRYFFCSVLSVIGVKYCREWRGSRQGLCRDYRNTLQQRALRLHRRRQHAAFQIRCSSMRRTLKTWSALFLQLHRPLSA